MHHKITRHQKPMWTWILLNKKQLGNRRITKHCTKKLFKHEQDNNRTHKLFCLLDTSCTATVWASALDYVNMAIKQQHTQERKQKLKDSIKNSKNDTDYS